MRVVVFPVKGRNWCFARSLLDAAKGSDRSSAPPPKWKELWSKVTSSDGRSVQEKAEVAADFIADKMNRAWIGLEKAPPRSIKSRIHSLGLKLLSRVKPSESLLKSVSKEVTKVEITYPASLNPRHVRRRLRHVAIRGSAIHRKHFYGSASLLPLTAVFSVLPLPNIPFFWILFRAYSNWRALQGSERLKLLVSDSSISKSSLVNNGKENQSTNDLKHALKFPWVLQPSKDLDKILGRIKAEQGVSDCAIATICKAYDLEKRDVMKYRDTL